jgi:cellulose synthase/poly-beta-1,6-N-acetylglucosamine synthase-like glycosyltransferase
MISNAYDIIYILNYLILIYVFLLMTTYLILSFTSYLKIKKYYRYIKFHDEDKIFELRNHVPISIIAPAYNESNGIVDSVKALLQLEYPEFQIIVVNDGSKDDTLLKLINNFNLSQIYFNSELKIDTQDVISVYASGEFKNLVVVNKKNGGKADALNAGVNIAKYPLIATVDADSILERDCLLKIVTPFIENENVVAVGGTIRIANGCKIRSGHVESVDLPKQWLVKFQVLEYIRAFIFGRSGFDTINSLMIISGAFSCFKKESVFQVGGFKAGSIGEDMEITIRLHRQLRLKNPEARIAFIPDPVCWTEAPEDIKVLKSQRVRWQKGTIESLLSHKKMLFNPNYKWLGLIGYPYFFFFEMLGPVVEFAGYVLIILSFLFNWVSSYFAIIFFFLLVLYGIIISTFSVLLEELTHSKYPKPSHLIQLIFIAIVENFGYRQMTVFWRFLATIEYLFGKRKWGKMKKKGFGQ